ncbi:MAG: hypothetical protein AAF518_29115 [Spirochaetota bacterium]
MQYKKLFDEIFKEVLREILHLHHLEVEYEIPGNPKRVDFYLEAKDVPINSTMVYLKVFAKYNLIEFKSEGDRFRIEDIYTKFMHILQIFWYAILKKQASYVLSSSVR